MKLIYAADDEKNIRNLIKSFLEKEGYIVEIFDNGDKLYEAFNKKQSDMVILDITMPGSDGFSICNKLRQISNVPIIMLTARDGETDYVTGITLGSDDYFTKPFRPLKLVMRIKAIFRRIGMEKESNENNEMHFGDISISLNQKTAKIKNNDIALTMTELNFLSFLLENSNRAVSREELLNKIWGYDNIVETRVTDDTVKRLRKKLSDAKSIVKIETIWGFGFRLKTEDD